MMPARCGCHPAVASRKVKPGPLPGRGLRCLNDVALTVTDDTSSGLFLAAGDLDSDGRPDVVMPYEGGVLILRQDPARPGALLRGTALP